MPAKLFCLYSIRNVLEIEMRVSYRFVISEMEFFMAGAE